MTRVSSKKKRRIIYERDLEQILEPHLEWLNTSGALGTRADLSDVKIEPDNMFLSVDLRRKNLSKALLVNTLLDNVKLSNADLSGADLRGANFAWSHLVNTNFNGANLSGAYFYAAKLSGADLQNADLRGAKAYVLDGNFMRNTAFSSGARDLWSVLRRNYTGIMVLFHLLFASLFFVSYGLETAGTLLPLGSGQMMVGEGDLVLTSPCKVGNICEEYPVWKVLLGFHKGVVSWEDIPLIGGLLEKFLLSIELSYSTLSFILVGYNALRIYLTRRVVGMREEEERSHYTPVLHGRSGYGVLYRIHVWIMRPLMIFTALILLLRATEFGSIVVNVPT